MPPQPKPPTPIALELYVDGLNAPLDITHANDSRLFIAEAPGRIRIAKSQGNLLTTPFLDITSRVYGGLPSLLGFVFHPNYAVNGYFYVHYLYLTQGTNILRSRISRFQRSINPDIANPNSEFVIMEYAETFGTEHFGGDMHFGPDGYLYMISGDSNDAIRAQRFNSLLGKLLRIDVNGAPGVANAPDCDVSGRGNYRIPPGNAFTDSKLGQGCDEIYALGFRNPWNFSFDRLTGDIWLGDVGAETAEEIDFIPAGASGGLNLGWRCYEANGVYDLTGCNRSYLFPVLSLLHESDFSVMGGYVYRGKKYPQFKGQYFFTDFFNSSIRTLTGPRSKPIVNEVLTKGFVSSPVSFGEDNNGELYVVSYDGTVYRIIDPTVP
ncbi:MAG: PQQ-dependent sugar dehydrogenase [Methylococcaceae bacterium]|nr:PQQ-dependent sugar dehydrogenase [Methylococcaceae bacterium]